MKAKKRIRIVIVVLLFILVAVTAIFALYQRPSEAAKNITSIHVNLKTETKMIYGKKEFDINDTRLIDKILSFVQDYKVTENTYKEKKKSDENWNYEIILTDKNGNQATYHIAKESLKKGNLLQEVLEDKEVVQQIRSFYTVDETKVKNIELCKWSENVENEVKKQLITNKETIEHLFELCKEWTLKAPQDSAAYQQSELYFYNKKGKVLAVFYFSKDSKCYKELVAAFPEIKNFV